MNSPLPRNRGTIMNSPIRRISSSVMNSPVSHSRSSYYQRRGNRRRGGRPRPSSGSWSSGGSVVTSDSLESGVIRTIPEAQLNTTTPLPCDGNITLYSSTYHRGDNVTIETDTENLLSVNFDNRLVSVSVSDCCWNIFTDPFYSGEFKKFSPGEIYQSVSSVGNMFRAAPSIKKIP